MDYYNFLKSYISRGVVPVKQFLFKEESSGIPLLLGNIDID